MGSRSYKQNCALAIALDVVGERWTLLIIRELLIGERRFGELQHNLPGIGTNLLSARLAELADAGVILRSSGGGHPLYSLSELGRGLEPAVMALIRWGMGFHEQRADKIHTRVQWSLLPLRDRYDPTMFRDWAGSFAFTLDDETGWIACQAGELELHSQPVDPVLAQISLDSATAARLSRGELTVADARSSGALIIDGDEHQGLRFLAAFPAD